MDVCRYLRWNQWMAAGPAVVAVNYVGGRPRLPSRVGAKARDRQGGLGGWLSSTGTCAL